MSSRPLRIERGRLPLGPAEPFGPLVVTVLQRLAGEGLVFIPIDLGIVPQAQLERVDAERVAQLVHRAFERVDPDRRTWRSHIHRAGEIDLHEFVTDFEIVAVIEHAAPIDDVLLVVLEARCVGDSMVLQRL